jgi:hypothetical protein
MDKAIKTLTIRKGVKHFNKYYKHTKEILHIQYYIDDIMILQHKVDFSDNGHLGYFKPLYLLGNNMYIQKSRGIIKRPVSSKIKSLGLDPNTKYLVEHFNFEEYEYEFKHNC